MSHSNCDEGCASGASDDPAPIVEIFVDENLAPPVEIFELERIAREVLRAEGAEACELSVRLSDDSEVRALNRVYRERDEATDVLSFVAAEALSGTLPVHGTSRMLGDIIISLSAVMRNAEEFNVREEEELRRVLIHGVLHLCGRNHATNDAREPMLLRQEELLKIICPEQPE